MDEKMFNLLEKMYVEMQEIKTELRTEMQEMKTELRTEMQEMKTELGTEMQEIKTELRTEMRQGFVKLENKMDENHKALYDGYKQSIEGINETKEKLEKLTDKVDNQEIKLQVLKSVK